MRVVLAPWPGYLERGVESVCVPGVYELKTSETMSTRKVTHPKHRKTRLNTETANIGKQKSKEL